LIEEIELLGIQKLRGGATVASVLLTAVLAACGGGSASDASSSQGTTATTDVVGAVSLAVSGGPDLPLNGTTTQVTVGLTPEVPKQVELSRDNFTPFATWPNDAFFTRSADGKTLTGAWCITSSCWNDTPGAHVLRVVATYADGSTASSSVALNVADSAPTPPAPVTAPVTPPVTPPVTAPAIEYLGRFDMSNPAQPHFSWSGSTIKARFNGTSVSVDLSNIYANNYTYSIDGGAPTIFTLGDGTPRTTTVLATGLSAGFHTVQVTRNNSTFDGETVFYGFNFGSGTLAAPAAYASPLRLEVYGDSIGAAGGITGSNCSDIIAAEDAYLGYAHVATRTLGAQAPTLIVYSGHGISHGYNSELGARTIPALYNQTGVGSQIWNFPAATAPNVVVIALGTNDISDVPSTGQFPSDATMTAAYVSFANTLRSKYPSAMFVMTVGPMTFGYQAAVTAAVSQLHSAGDSNVYSLIHSAQTLTGCAGHPGVAQHAVMAKDLVAFLHNHGY
jgi:lysophospholipase L1-like esterase